jgi:uncharacterized protein YoxC
MELEPGIILGLLVVVFAVALLFFGIIISNVKRDIENAISEASEEEQEEIRKKLVKALYPPRFFRD